MTQPETTRSNSTERRIIMIVLVIGILLAAFFGFRTVRSFIRIQRSGLHPGMSDVEAIRGWMTVPYIAKAYQVPPDYIFEQIGVPARENNKSSISDLNFKYYYGQQGVVLGKVKAAIQRFRSENPTPPGPPQ